ncbi:MAG: alpha-mannosidase [Sedimentisphaeraceae bacterium JB056]
MDYRIKKIDADSLNAKFAWEIERFNSQVDFLGRLFKQRPELLIGKEDLLEQAQLLVSNAVDAGKLSELVSSVRKAEEILSPFSAVAKEYTIHCVGHAHIDMNWQWNWPETVAVVNDTFTTVLRLLDKYEDFCFSQSQGAVYDIVRKYNPEMLKRIKAYVQQGRWEIAASQWVEGEKNFVSGESLVRHLLYTREFCKEHFDLDAEDVSIDWEPDTFGHANTIPMILSGGGVSHYYCGRTGEDDDLPPIFYWQSPDGSKVLVNKESSWYFDFIGSHNVKGLMNFVETTNLKDWMCVFGVGDHGGGPTERDIKYCIEMDSWPLYPNMKFSTTKKYYRIVQQQYDNIPVVEGELNFEFEGCYTSQSRIKKAVRDSENRLLDAETAAVISDVFTGENYPFDTLRKAWQDTLFAHFHDILPGSCTPEARDYQMGQAQNVLADTSMITTLSLRKMSSLIDTSFAGSKNDNPAVNTSSRSSSAGVGRNSADGQISSFSNESGPLRPFVIFNPTGWKRSEVVKLTVWDGGSGFMTDDVKATEFTAVFPDGTKVSADRVSQGRYWQHEYVELMVPVTVEAFGYTTVIIEPAGEFVSMFAVPIGYDKKQTDVKCLGEPVKNGMEFHRIRWKEMGQMSLENEFIQVLFNKKTGNVSAMVDKKTGINICDDKKNTSSLEYLEELPDPMAAWRIATEATVSGIRLVSLEPSLRGSYVTSVTAKYKVKSSTVSVEYFLKQNSPYLEMELEVDWKEIGDSNIGTPGLRMNFPAGFDIKHSRFDTPFGAIERNGTNGSDVPGLLWADVSDDDGGFAVVSEYKHGYGIVDNTLRLNLIRSSYNPDPMPEVTKHNIKLALMPYSGKMDIAELKRVGHAFGRQLQPVSTDVHDGKMPAVSQSMINCDSDSVIIEAIKKSQDDSSIVVRLLETLGEKASVSISCCPQLASQLVSAQKVDLLERPLDSSELKIKNNRVMLDVEAYSVETIKIYLRR